jgi:hypothetical protein
MIVVTTASRYGITVMGDKAQTSLRGQTREVHNDARKVHSSAKANVSLACWGDARMLRGSLDLWAATFVEALTAADSVENVGRRLETELSSVLEPLPKRAWHEVRRGAHIAAYFGVESQLNATVVRWIVHDRCGCMIREEICRNRFAERRGFSWF